MKGEIRKKYQEFVNHIDFPAIIYIYENNKILAINSYAKSIVGAVTDDVRQIFDGKKLKFPKNLLNGGSNLYLNVAATTVDREKIHIDMDVSILKVDNVHFALVLFENSFKNNFVGHLSIQTPRVSWMYADNMEEMGMNTGLQNDIKMVEELSTGDSKLGFLDEEIEKKLSEIGRKIVETGESQYNSIQMITTIDKNSGFIKVHRMPIVNNAGENIGILSVHSKILNKEKYKALYDTAIRSNNMVNEIIDKGDTIFISWLCDEKSTVQYISPNIARYGYLAEDFYSGIMNFKSIIFSEDYPIIQCKFKEKQDTNGVETKTSEYEYRIHTADGEAVWVHEECTPVVLNNSIVYNFSSLKDITSRKKLELELNDRKSEYQLKKEKINKSDDINFRMFKLEDLFDFDEIKNMQLLLGEVMYITSFVTDEKGMILTEPMAMIGIDNELDKLIRNRRSIKKYKDCGVMAYKKDAPYTDDFYFDAIKVSAIPFIIGGVHLGNVIIIAVLGALDARISEKYEKKYKKYFQLFKISDKQNTSAYGVIIKYINEYIRCLCRAEVQNIELIKEKESLVKTADKLQDSYNAMGRILDNIDSCIFVISIDDYIINFANLKIRKMYSEDIVGSDMFSFLIGHGIESCSADNPRYLEINKALSDAKEDIGNYKKVSKFYDNINKKYLSTTIENIMWIDGSKALLVTMNDITYAENNLDNEKNMYSDYLTGLPNRLQFEIDAKNSIMKSIEKNQNGAIIMFDLDNFKTINNKYGHEFGEAFVKEVARRITSNIEFRNCTYRCRGVEFLVIIDCDYQDDIDRLADKILEYFMKSWVLMNEETFCPISMGITRFPRDGINPVELLKNADLAMYDAKKYNESCRIDYKAE